jgi:hypothetical protein
MATISTRVLSADRLNDFLTLSVDPVDLLPGYGAGFDGGFNSLGNLRGKTGFYKVVINSITWEGTGVDTGKMLTLDVRVPQFNEQNDVAIIDNLTLDSSDLAATFSIDTIVAAVNQGIPGPSIYTQGDGTWDLLNIKTSLPASTDITDFVLTVDYTLTFTEVGSTQFDALTAGSVDLSVDDDKNADAININITPATGAGVYIFLPVSLETLVDDQVVTGDSVPAFTLTSYASIGGYGYSRSLISHAISKSSSHTKNYVDDTAYVIAVNDGNADGNAALTHVFDSGSTVAKHLLCSASLYRVDAWPTDDKVDATLNFKMGFISA